MLLIIRGVVGRRRGGRHPPLFSTGGRVPHFHHYFGLKFVQTLVHCCNWLLTETECKIISVQQNVFLTCMSVRVCRPKLFKNLCLSLVSGVPQFFLGLGYTPVDKTHCGGFCRINYLNIYRSDLHDICRICRTLDIDSYATILPSLPT